MLERGFLWKPQGWAVMSLLRLCLVQPRPWLSGPVSPKRVHPFSLTLAWPLVLFLTVRSEVSQVSDRDTVLRGEVGALRAQPSESKVPKINSAGEKKSVGREQRRIYVSSEADNSIQKP